MPEWVSTRLKHLYGQEPAETNQLRDVIGELDVIYVNRLQEERLPPGISPEAARGSYLVDVAIMDYAKPDGMIMHPLPRVNELAYELDEDERAAYFDQSANAVPIRMALLASLLGLEQLVLTQPPTRKMVSDQGSCENPNCVTNHEPYLGPETEIIAGPPSISACAYCGALKT